MSTKPLAWTWEIRWGNPYTEPPHGQPRVRLSVTRPVSSAHLEPPIFDRALQIIGYGRGWVFSCGPTMPEPRRLSAEARGQLRKRRLQSRVERAAPLFANELVQIELAANPGYFAGEDVQR